MTLPHQPCVKNYSVLDDGINMEDESKILIGNRKHIFWQTSMKDEFTSEWKLGDMLQWEREFALTREEKLWMPSKLIKFDLIRKIS